MFAPCAGTGSGKQTALLQKIKCRISLLRTTDMAGPAGLVPPSSGNHPTNLNKTAPPISNLHPCAGVLKRKKLLRSHADAATRRQIDAARPGARHSWSALLRLHGSARLALACLCSACLAHHCRSPAPAQRQGTCACARAPASPARSV